MPELVDLSRLPHAPGDAYSALPHAMARLPFFVAIVYRGRVVRPAFTKDTLIGSLGQVEIFQTSGERLDEQDADVYLELVRRSMHSTPADGRMLTLTFDAHEFLPTVGRDRGTNNMLWLDSVLRRLLRANFRFNLPGLNDYESSLVAEIESTEDTERKTRRHYTLTLNARMAKVFKEAGYGLVDMRIRALLITDPVAKGLYSIYASHRHTRFMRLAELRRALGRHDQSDKDFVKKVLRPALESLKAATDWHVVRYNDKRGGVELFRSAQDKQAVDERVEQKPSGNSEKTKTAAAPVRSLAPPAKAKAPMAQGAASADVQAWLQRQGACELNSVLFDYGASLRLEDRNNLGLLREKVLALFAAGLTVAEAQAAVENTDI